MNIRNLLNTDIGVAIVSIVLGLGLASLFRKVCSDKNCIVFNGPIISEVTEKTYKNDDKCYKYEVFPSHCDKTKRIVDLKSPDEMDKR
jgi:hypothetical protein